MAELLVRVVDKVNRDSIYLDVACTKRGDVIAICVDGWQWGKEELANPDWRIVRLPGVDPEDLSGLLAPERDVDPKNPSKTLQRRAFKLDLDRAEIDKANLRTFFDDHTVTPITVKSGDVAIDAIVDTVESKIETITMDANGDVTVSVEVVSREVSKVPVEALDDAVQAKLAGLAVTFVGETLRNQCAVECAPDLIQTITTMKPPIDDPAVIGKSPNVIG